MPYVLTSSALNIMDIEEITKKCESGYFHVSPKIKRINIINLGMEKEDLVNLVKFNCSVNVFNENFSLDKLMSIPCDAIYISDGRVHDENIPCLVEKVKKIIGIKKIIGTGIGKEIIERAAKEKDIKISSIKRGLVLKNEEYDIYCFKLEDNGNLIELFKLI